MLIGIFKSNQKLFNILVVLITLVVWIPSLWIDSSITNNGMFAGFINGVRAIGWLNYLMAVLFISVQAIYLNYIINELKLVKNNTHLVALFFVLLNGLSPALLAFNSIVIANTFVLIMFHQLSKTYNIQQPFSVSFNTGFLIALATLFYFPFIVLFIFTWVVFAYAGIPKWRNFIISIIGFLVPFIFYGAYLFLTDSYKNMNETLGLNAVIFGEGFIQKHLPILYYTLLGISLLSFFHLLLNVQKDVIKIRKFKMVFLMMLFFILLFTLINGADYVAVYVVMIIPLSMFFANYFNEIKRSWLAELLLILLLTAATINHFS
jgi:hypothetical protein